MEVGITMMVMTILILEMGQGRHTLTYMHFAN